MADGRHRRRRLTKAQLRVELEAARAEVARLRVSGRQARETASRREVALRAAESDVLHLEAEVARLRNEVIALFAHLDHAEERAERVVQLLLAQRAAPLEVTEAMPPAAVDLRHAPEQAAAPALSDEPSPSDGDDR